jgi:hypothetical protein
MLWRVACGVWRVACGVWVCSRGGGCDTQDEDEDEDEDEEKQLGERARRGVTLLLSQAVAAMPLDVRRRLLANHGLQPDEVDAAVRVARRRIEARQLLPPPERFSSFVMVEQDEASTAPAMCGGGERAGASVVVPTGARTESSRQKETVPAQVRTAPTDKAKRAGPLSLLKALFCPRRKSVSAASPTKV